MTVKKDSGEVSKDEILEVISRGFSSVEESITSFKNEVNNKFEQVDRRFDGLERRIDDLANTRARTEIVEELQVRVEKLEDKVPG